MNKYGVEIWIHGSRGGTYPFKTQAAAKSFAKERRKLLGRLGFRYFVVKLEG